MKSECGSWNWEMRVAGCLKKAAGKRRTAQGKKSGCKVRVMRFKGHAILNSVEGERYTAHIKSVCL
ncbi:hypothetical protein D1BOALGB6SA_2839 [Olavius sp. associated proteobacterium Delta 1]|nr:hypothetical protein D1BOALGB6SA_2839 [Olavius sp. associated proteobacterium Delta 1]